MANTLLSPTVITREALRILHQKLRFIGTINRQYDSQYAKSGAKIGSTLAIRLPNQFTVTTGAALNVADITEKSINLTVSTQAHVDFTFPTSDLTLTIDDYSKRYLDPAMARLAAYMEVDALNMYKDVPNEVADDGDTMSTADILEGTKILRDHLAPDDLTLLLNTRDNVSLVNANTGVFNPAGNIGGAWKEGMVQNQFMGFNRIMESSLMPTHTSGTDDGTGDYLTDIAGSEADGTSDNPEDGGELNVDTGSGSFVVGDIIEIEDVLEVHPESKVSLGTRRQFVITQTSTPTASGGSIYIYPAIVASGAKQNVNAAAANNKIIYKVERGGTTAIGNAAAYGISMGYAKDAFTFATADLILPKGVDFAAREVFDGISMRIVRDYNINNDQMPCRIDVLYGYKAIRPDWAVRYGH